MEVEESTKEYLYKDIPPGRKQNVWLCTCLNMRKSAKPEKPCKNLHVLSLELSSMHGASLGALENLVFCKKENNSFLSK